MALTLFLLLAWLRLATSKSARFGPASPTQLCETFRTSSPCRSPGALRNILYVIQHAVAIAHNAQQHAGPPRDAPEALAVFWKPKRLSATLRNDHLTEYLF
jgi:hypothetical protein